MGQTGYRYVTEPAGGGENQIPFREIQNPAYAATIALKATDARTESLKVAIGQLTGNLALSMDTTLPYALDELVIVFKADTSNRTITFGAGFSGLASLIVTASTTSTVKFVFDGTNWNAQAASVSGSLSVAGGVTTPTVTAITPLTTTPVGTVAVKEYTNGRDVVTELTLTNFIVGALAGSAAALGVGNIVAAFPTGIHFELVQSLSSVVFTAAGTAVTGVAGLGSVIASGAVSVLSGTATFQDRLAGTAATTGASGGAAVSALACVTAGIGTGIALNVAASVKNVFLNFAGTWNANNTGNLTASGTIVLKWTRME